MFFYLDTVHMLSFWEETRRIEMACKIRTLNDEGLQNNREPFTGRCMVVLEDFLDSHLGVSYMISRYSFHSRHAYDY